MRVFIGLERGFVHQAAKRKVGEQEPVKFLPHQVRRFAAQDDLRSAPVGLEFVLGGFDFPALLIKGRQRGGWER